MEEKNLLEKYLQGKSSHEELSQLYEYLQQGKLSQYEDFIDDIWKQLQYDDSRLSEEKSKLIFGRIQKDISDRSTPTTPLYKRWPLYGVAASIVFIIAAAILLLDQPTMVEVSTAYQETLSVTLPDGTEVILNANSSLRYPEDILTQDAREIWIQGEAFFEVKSLQNAAAKIPFVVHTDIVDIRVLGTQFNVKDRHGKAEVVLKEGKIRLFQPQNPDSKLDMEPGQRVLADAESGLQLSQVEDPKLYASWKNNELYFDNQSLASIAQKIQDEYGIEVTFAHSDLRQLQFTGSAPADQLEVLIISLEKSFNLNIQKDEKRYIIDKGLRP